MADISVVILTKDRKAQVMRMLAWWEPVMSEAEVIVAHDSADGTPGAVKEAYGSIVKVLDGPGRGAVAALNAGLRAAKNDRVLFLGEDCLPTGNAFEFLARLEEDFSRADMVGLRLLGDGRFFDHPWVGSGLWLVAGQKFPYKGCQGRYLEWAQVFAIDRSKVPLFFDEHFCGSGFNAELDFHWRAKETGATLWYDPKLMVQQQDVGGKRRGPETRLRTRNHARFLRHHFPLSWPVKQLFFVLYLQLSMSVRWAQR